MCSVAGRGEEKRIIINIHEKESAKKKGGEILPFVMYFSSTSVI